MHCLHTALRTQVAWTLTFAVSILWGFSVAFFMNKIEQVRYVEKWFSHSQYRLQRSDWFRQAAEIQQLSVHTTPG